MPSNAVPTELISRVVGYKITKGDFSNNTPNLPQRIAIIGEANTANQSGLTTDPVEITSSQQAGEIFGYGSPIHMAMRILRPVSGDGVGGIPTVVYPQATEVSATAHEYQIAVTGTASGNKTHFVRIAGRTTLDGNIYAVNVVDGDTNVQVAQKIEDAVNNVLESPFIAAHDGLGNVTFTSKWKGKTAFWLQLEMETDGDAVGMTYAQSTTSTGNGIPTTIGSSLDLFENDWNTIVLNTYGVETTVLDILEAFNGIPDPNTPTGRYASTIMKPFIALTGTTKDNETTVTDARPDNVTIAICPAPNSSAHPLEATANMAVLFARTAQDSPHRDINGRSYPDMPGPIGGSIGSMAQYINRDAYVKKGHSTVDFNAGKYRVQDFVTTYHPTGEPVPQFRYCRNLMLDFNVRFGYYLLEQIYVVDKTIAENNEPVAVSGVIKPKGWKGILFTYADDLVARALIVDAAFMQDSLIVNISSVNPDRLETFFRYKRSGVARISSTTAEAGFNFGTL